MLIEKDTGDHTQLDHKITETGEIRRVKKKKEKM